MITYVQAHPGYIRKPRVSRRRGEPICDGRDSGGSGVGSLAAGQVAVGVELGGEGDVAGEGGAALRAGEDQIALIQPLEAGQPG